MISGARNTPYLRGFSSPAFFRPVRAGPAAVLLRPAYCMDSKNSMPLLSAVRVTMAFFQAGVMPW